MLGEMMYGNVTTGRDKMVGEVMSESVRGERAEGILRRKSG